MGHDWDSDRCSGCGDTADPHTPSETCEFGKPPWRAIFEARPVFQGGKFVGFEIRDGRKPPQLSAWPTTIVQAGDELVLRYRMVDKELLPVEEAARLEAEKLREKQEHCRYHLRTPNGVCTVCGHEET